jgi:dipeptidyl aminopeptidase/acylaminoacyl peptidase
MPYDGTSEQQLTTSPGNSGAPAFSPDGTKIAFHSDRATLGRRQIYVMNADGSSQTRVTTNTANDSDPSWNDDGTRLAITSDRSGNSDIWTVGPQRLVACRPDGVLLERRERSRLVAGRPDDPLRERPRRWDIRLDDERGRYEQAEPHRGVDLRCRRRLGRRTGSIWPSSAMPPARTSTSGRRGPPTSSAAPTFNVDFGNAQLRLTDVCIGYTISDTASKTYVIESPPSSANCDITQDHSITGDTASSIEFDNQSGRTVDIYWLDYEGNRVYYTTLNNENQYTQPTYFTHPWVMIAEGPWRNSFPDWGRSLPLPGRQT